MAPFLQVVWSSLTVVALCLSCTSTDARAQEQAARVAIGANVEGLKFTDARYLPRRLEEFGERRGFVLYFVTVECPLVLRYLPRVAEIAADYAARGVQFVAVNVGAGDTLVDAMAQAVDYDITFPFVKDFDGSVAARLGVDRTAAVVVLDAERRLFYRGRIDSQYRYGGVRPDAGRADLREALDDLLAGVPARTAETEWEGCAITAAREPAPGELTWAADIQAIVQRNCQDCHHPGGDAPIALMTYDDVLDNAAMIEEVVAQRRMPPWYAASRFDGHFVNQRALSDDDRRALLAWLAHAEPPRGDPAREPAAREFPPREWRIEDPDLVLKLPTPERLPAEGYVPYRYVVMPHRFASDTWVEAFEIRSDNPRVLHHANLVHYRLGDSFSNDGFITGQVPGGDPMVCDPGTAVKIPAGSVLGLQIHYVTTGKPEVDRIRVGLRFPRVPVQRELRPMIVTNTRFRIPPHAEGHAVPAKRQFREDSIGVGMFVHMHLRGRDMKFVAHTPDGTAEELLLVPNYNFDWQQSYRWPTASKRFAQGTRVEVIGRFDNSTFNPFNPDADAEVGFGQQTFDEMMYGFLFYVHEAEALGLRVDPKTGVAIQ